MLPGMKGFFRRISPRRAVSDFATHWQEPTPHRWQILGVAMAATFAIFMLFVPDSQRIAPEKPDVWYISTFEDGRTDTQIIASNCENQRYQDDIAEMIAASEERKREIYRELGRATFIDVDEIEAELAAERAAAEAAGEAGPSPEEIAARIQEYCARAAAG